MKLEAIIHFPPFRLDCTTEQLWQGTQLLPLRPKPLAILRYLAEHPHRLVTKEELLKAVWPETCVSAGLLHTYIRDLRDVLRDDPETPRFIETVARRGYRFIAALTTASQPVQSPKFPLRIPHSAFALVGRETELAQLHQWLDKALQGELILKYKVQSAKCKVPNTQHPTPSTQEAEACFLKAIEIAQQQSAKLWELRAATSLARLWHGQGRRAEAGQLLAEVYGWFTEGFETADLQEAKALLTTLHAQKREH